MNRISASLLAALLSALALPGCYAPSSCQTYCGAAAAGGCNPDCIAQCEEDRRIAAATNCDESLSAAIDCAEENACTDLSRSTCRPSACRGYYDGFARCVGYRCVAHPHEPECLPTAPRVARSCAPTP